MQLTTEAFMPGDMIPKKYTCEGQNISPALHVENWPQGTQSLALIVEDLDAPSGTFDHWIAWNITPKSAIDEGEKLPYQGINDFGKVYYQGPCPPPGKPHRYYFKLYALDAMLDLAQGSKKKDLENAMQGHILAESSLMGLYER